MNPNSRLWLCKCDLENDYKNTLTFSNRNAQRNYFIGDPSDPSSTGVSTKGYVEYTYLRKEQAIKVDDLIDIINTNNYLVLINNNKYEYYFITRMEYIDDQTTKIHIELDVMQTYFFDIEYKQTFVEREHVTDDTPGKHTIPEGLETGEYIAGDSYYLTDEDNMVNNIVLQVVYNDELDTSLYTQYGGVFSGCLYMIMNPENAIKFIKHMDTQGRRDYILNIFMYYGNIASDTEYHITSIDYGTIYFKIVNPSLLSKLDENLTLINSKPSTIGSYTPRNKKLLTKDYQYLLENNQGGSAKQYAFEEFNSSSIKFARYSNVAVGGSIAYFPYNYKYDENTNTLNYNEGFMGAKFPTCCWTSDGYINWLTASGIDEKTEDAKHKNLMKGLAGAGMFGVGLFTGQPLLAIGGLGEAVKSIKEDSTITKEAMQLKEEHQIAPLEIQGFTGGGDVMYGINRCMPKFTIMHIKEEYAVILDKFFDQYGYQVNILKSPNINTRRYWNYLKTRNCNFTGNIPQEYMSRIKKIFDSGITFWHDPSKILDYTQNNTVI